MLSKPIPLVHIKAPTFMGEPADNSLSVKNLAMPAILLRESGSAPCGVSPCVFEPVAAGRAGELARDSLAQVLAKVPRR